MSLVNMFRLIPAHWGKLAWTRGFVQAHIAAMLVSFQRADAASSVGVSDGPFQRLASLVASWHSGESARSSDGLLRIIRGLLKWIKVSQSQLPSHLLVDSLVVGHLKWQLAGGGFCA